MYMCVLDKVNVINRVASISAAPSVTFEMRIVPISPPAPEGILASTPDILSIYPELVTMATPSNFETGEVAKQARSKLGKLQHTTRISFCDKA